MINLSHWFQWNRVLIQYSILFDWLCLSRWGQILATTLMFFMIHFQDLQVFQWCIHWYYNWDQPSCNSVNYQMLSKITITLKLNSQTVDYRPSRMLWANLKVVTNILGLGHTKHDHCQIYSCFAWGLFR